MSLIDRGQLWLIHAQLRTADAWYTATMRRAGQSTVEYALVGALVVIAAAGALTILGTQVTTIFSKISTTLSGAAGR